MPGASVKQLTWYFKDQELRSVFVVQAWLYGRYGYVERHNSSITDTRQTYILVSRK